MGKIINLPLPKGVAHIAIGDDTEDVFTEEQMRDYAEQMIQAYISSLDMSDDDIIKVARESATAEPGRDGYILPISFARTILNKLKARQVREPEQQPISVNALKCSKCVSNRLPEPCLGGALGCPIVFMAHQN